MRNFGVQQLVAAFIVTSKAATSCCTPKRFATDSTKDGLRELGSREISKTHNYLYLELDSDITYHKMVKCHLFTIGVSGFRNVS